MDQSQDERRPLLLVISRCAWTMWTFRLPLLLAADEAGYEVVAACGSVPEFDGRLRDRGIGLFHVPLLARSVNPLGEFRTLRALYRLIRSLQPDIVHTFTIKPTIYGRIAARAAGVPCVVSTITGLGHLFVASGARAAVIRSAACAAYRIAFSHSNSTVIFQNPDDRRLFEQAGLLKTSRARLSRGSGVDLTLFVPAAERAGPPIVLMVARLIAEKGVREFVAAARLVRAVLPEARFVVVGDDDSANPDRIPSHERDAWVDEGLIELWGYRDDLTTVYGQSSLVCLPSYREGLPRVLLEAAACAKPLVATDVPGCREVVVDGVNGLLVPARDHARLAEAILKLLKDRGTRIRFGQAARRHVEEHFGLDRILADTFATYSEMMPSHQAGSEHAGVRAML